MVPLHTVYEGYCPCVFKYYEYDLDPTVADPTWEEEELAQSTISVVSLQRWGHPFAF
jgi:hypothetical protein